MNKNRIEKNQELLLNTLYLLNTKPNRAGKKHKANGSDSDKKKGSWRIHAKEFPQTGINHDKYKTLVSTCLDINRRFPIPLK